ncbi:hypothetical protein DOTSEDRAFT_23329 [Dothistroma septosporum NZE10]|uniref:Uncharacterized protein n=1 Tax=Dothistroma septosporum (strain NZE10 / CBS 128990) TaxID=675120 RepID=N1PPD3_DOTSN|nr:hypothetical protein DOTSEDRAFT_23329 [Dothistroma septosporum NZE10]
MGPSATPGAYPTAVDEDIFGEDGFKPPFAPEVSHGISGRRASVQAVDSGEE